MENEAILTLLDEPSINVVNTIPEHSDHKILVNDSDISVSLNGTWKFKYFERFDESIYTYLLPTFSLKELDEIKVPSHLEFNGYSSPIYVNHCYPWYGHENVELGKTPKNNPIGLYFKEFKMDKPLNSKIVLKFEGFENAIYVFLNGKMIGYSEKGYTNSEFDLTSSVEIGVNRIAVVLFKYCKSSWFLDQDMWRLSGITRDVSLVFYPLVNIFDIDNKSELISTNKGLLDIKLKIDGDLTNTNLNYFVEFNNQIILKNSINLTSNEVLIKQELNAIYPWSSECPHLYKVIFTLTKGETEIEKAILNVGFRKLSIENGVLLLNGKRLILKGVNRHEFDSKVGRAITKEIIESDIKFLKAHNFNALRTSHYPNNSYLYELCDKYGIYLVDEAPIETHGTWFKKTFYKKDKNEILPNNHKEFLPLLMDKTLGMYERDKNHPSILMWSLGNESYGGSVFKTIKAKLNEIDKTRIVHYEGDKKLTDIYSEMYNTPKGISKFIPKHLDKPYMLCEFEHAMGNSLGNFDEYMDLFDKFKNYAGGFIWDFVDQGIYDKKNDTYNYGGDFLDRPNDGTFVGNGILYSDRKPTAKAEEAKYFYQDLKFIKNESTIRIVNLNLFKDTSMYYFKLSMFENGELVSENNFDLNILPGKNFDLDLKTLKYNHEKEVLIRISYHDKNDTLYSLKDHEVGFFETLINSSLDKGIHNPVEIKDEKLEILINDYNTGVKGEGFNYIFGGKLDAISAGLISYRKNNTEFIKNYPYVSLFRPITDNDEPMAKFFLGKYMSYQRIAAFIPRISRKESKYDGKSIKFTYKYKYFDSPFIRNSKITYEVFNGGDIKVTATMNFSPFMSAPSEFGVTLMIPYVIGGFTYYGLGEKDNYIDRYHAQKLGVYESSPEKEMVNYLKPQECGNHLFTRYLILNGENNEKMTIYSSEKAFSFKVLPHSNLEIDNATHEDELPKQKYTYVTIMNETRGVGGDNSWLNPVHKKYRMKRNKKYKVEFVIKNN